MPTTTSLSGLLRSWNAAPRPFRGTLPDRRNRHGRVFARSGLSSCHFLPRTPREMARFSPRDGVNRGDRAHLEHPLSWLTYCDLRFPIWSAIPRRNGGHSGRCSKTHQRKKETCSTINTPEVAYQWDRSGGSRTAFPTN